MNDRFKFRVYITAPITRDVEEEKEVSFYIYDIALYDDGGIGFSRDSLLDALDKLNLTEGQRNEIEDYISDNSYSEDWEWYAISFDRIEQCTGLKDKNGKLIYEGDILNSLYRSDGCEGLYKIVWCEGRLLPEKFGNHQQKQVTIHLTNLKWCEVIGNIHENADLLENEE